MARLLCRFRGPFLKLQLLGKPGNYLFQKSQSRLEELQPAQTKPAGLLETVHRGQISDKCLKTDKFNVVSASLNIFFLSTFTSMKEALSRHLRGNPAG